MEGEAEGVILHATAEAFLDFSASLMRPLAVENRLNLLRSTIKRIIVSFVLSQPHLISSVFAVCFFSGLAFIFFSPEISRIDSLFH